MAVRSPSPSPDAAARQATFCATLVDEWVECGLRHAVVAPGSRSTPMALAFARHDDIIVHIAHDERTAAFMALGVGVATRRPAAVLCTSGTAAAHFHAAVVEAHQACVPLLVLTADRPAELHGVGAPQTIDQQDLYGNAVRLFFDADDAATARSDGWRELAGRVLRATGGVHPGPVHLNLPFREPLVGIPGALPGRAAEAVAAAGVPEPAGTDTDERVLDALVAAIEAQRGVIVAGRGCGGPAAVGAFADAVGWPVLADPRSGCSGVEGAVSAFDSILRYDEFARAHTPEVVVRLGEFPASKVLAAWLAASGARQVHIGAEPVVRDPDGVVAHRIVADPVGVLGDLAARLRGAVGTPWRARWVRAAALADAAIGDLIGAESHLSEPGVARTVLQSLPSGGQLVVSSSMPVRDLEWFGGARSDVTVHSNRGANGIDGVVATALGVALATGDPTAVLLGDVALLHDSSSLAGLAARSVDLRVVVVDNDGGGIFSFLPQAAELDAATFEMLFGTPHGTDLVSLAAAHGLDAIRATDRQQLAERVRRGGPHVTVVPSDRAANVAAHRRLESAVRDALSR